MIVNLHKSGENEIGGIYELAKSIEGEGFVDMAIANVQGLVVEHEVGKTDLVEITWGN